ncbi:MAG: hypothetical protein ACXVCX_03735 [Ktedonobacterales bacterium]
MSEIFRERIEERGPLGWWYQQTAPREQPGASFAQRELVRRGRLASTILLGFLITGLIQLPFVYKGPQTLLMLLPAFLGMGLQIWLNRIGQVNVVGVLMVLISYSVLASLLTGGKLLDILSLPVLDMLVIPELMAVSLLPSISIFPVAVANSIIILTLARILPHTAELGAVLSTADGRAVLTRAIALQFIVAIVAYLWVRSAVLAIKRADQAEVIAMLERREAERTRELEEGVRQLLVVLVRLANGDFSSRVPLLANALLWRIGTAINTLIGRLERSSQAATLLQRFEEDANRLAQAIYALRPGDREVWITAHGTPLDRVLDALRDTLPRLSGPQTIAPAPGLSMGAGTFGPALPPALQPPTSPSPSQPPHLPEAGWPSLDDEQQSRPAQDLPEWLRQPDSSAQ